jgi:hypothetical protein
MEKKVEAVMEQTKILDLAFGRERSDRKQLVENAARIIKEKIGMRKGECDRILKGSKILIMGKSTSKKETKGGLIHTLPILLVCQGSLGRSQKERLADILRKAGLHVSFLWPKEWNL